MHSLNFESQTQASSALDLRAEFLSSARRLGCLAFSHGRIRAPLLVDFLEKHLAEINEDIADAHRWMKEPPTLNRATIDHLKRRIAELTVQAAPQKRFVGRALAQAVRRDLTPQLAAKLAGTSPELIAAEIAAVRERILANT